MAQLVLTARVMLNHSDIATGQPPRESSGPDFLSASTFLKPTFHITVGPRSGLGVHVALAGAPSKHERPVAQARH